MGRDISRMWEAGTITVSIHTPLWGATSTDCYHYVYHLCFNPHAPMGRDVVLFNRIIFEIDVSIHTPLWGATVISKLNSTGVHVSIHTPLWGATCYCGSHIYVVIMFQSTRPYGARLRNLVYEFTCNVGVSIHTPLWGATDTDEPFLPYSTEFQSTRPYGARPKF